MAQVLQWDAQELGISRELLSRVGRETAASDLALGETPETWSPLGELDAASFGRLRAQEEIIDALEPELRRAGRARFRIEDIYLDGAPVVSVVIDDTARASLAFDGDGFAILVPETTQTVGIEVEDDRADVWRALHLIADGSRHELVVWRVYTGNNSWIRDAVTRAREGVHRLSLRGLERGAVVVGRVVRVVANGRGASPGYPLYERSLAKAELADEPTAAAAPRLLAENLHGVDRAVVVIHGTMSHGLRLARAALDACGSCEVRRYEHDTWLRLETNAQELVDLVRRDVRSEVAFVAHSRGGLVAARAASILARSGGPRVSALVTLGTPFKGTPVAHGPDLGFLGVRALLGGLRYAGGPVVSATTRLAGLMLYGRTPPGLSVMSPTSEVLPLLRDTLGPQASTFAAVADDPAAERYGVAAVKGLGRGVFGSEPNDLVVAVSSARPHGGPAVIRCDHFSYLEDASVQNALRSLP